jgi:hypothetical protein
VTIGSGLLALVLFVLLAAASAGLITGAGAIAAWRAAPRAQAWAARRGVTLTARSAPFVEAYTRNARGLRMVCGAGAVLLAMAAAAGTGVDLQGIAFAWAMGGYMAGCVWAELSLARVPATTTRVASLAVREPARYTARWVRWGQVTLPLVLVSLAAVALTVEPRPDTPTTNAVDWWTAGPVRAQTVAAAVISVASLVVTVLAQRRIVSRPQPGDEADLVTADEALRISAVHLLGVTHIVLCLLLAVSGVLHVAYAVPAAAKTPVVALTGAIVVAAALLWTRRGEAPDGRVGTVAPAPSRPEAGEAVEPAGTAGGPSWRAPTRPDVTAAAVILALCLALWGLRWWGPLNPEVTAHVVTATIDTLAVPTGPATTRPAPQQLVVVVENHGAMTIGVTGIVVRGRAGGSVTDLVTVDRSGAARGSVEGRPVIATRIDGHATVALLVTVTPAPCPDGTPVVAPLEPLRLQLSSGVGRSFTVDAEPASPIRAACTVDLPTGPQPDDPAGARAAVEQAFARVYGGTEPDAAKGGLIDRPEGFDVLVAAAAGDPLAEGVRAEVTQLSFDRPDHAAVIYELRNGSGAGGARRGEAVLVDGTWRITRETLCQDLALVGVRCP